DSVVSKVRFDIPKDILMKNDLAVLNVIAANKWKRPIYFTSQFEDLGFGRYLRKEGLAYRFVPVEGDNINTDRMADKLMNTFSAGNANIPGVYFDESNRRQLMILRNAYAELAVNLAAKGRKEEARKSLQKADKMMIEENFPYGHISSGNMHNRSSLAFLEACYHAGAKDLIAKVSKSVKTDLTQQLRFYNALEGNKAEAMAFEKNMTENLLNAMNKMQEMYGPGLLGENSSKQLNVK
ncbi:MAG: rane protein, partial [Segetibacter sp.]|nr:rane protein [Segetibacter sp.]